jgi:MFS family permease
LSGVIVGRVVAGIGGAGVGALVSLIILDLVPLREVARLRGYVNIAATLGRSSGGPIGGALTDAIGWRSAFIIQCPLLLLAGLVAYPLVPTIKEIESVDIMTKLRRIDFAGSGLIAASVTTMMLVLEIAGQKLPWNHPVVLGLATVSVATGGLFLITETYWAAEPVFPLHLLRKRNVITAYLLLGLQISAQFSLMYCVPLYFEVIDNASSAVAGAHLFPAVAGNTLGALLTGWVIHRYAC